MLRKLVHFLLLIFIANNCFPRALPPYSSSEIYSSIKKLNVLGSALYIAAHPDDENTLLLAFLAKEKLYRTGYLSITRGDGGQNLVGDEQGIELGLIRTQELLEARRIDGAEQFFTRAFDFGYSKNPEETLEIWDREKILSDVVWVIRKFKPDVIITRFPETGEGGHGHHTASAILAKEAFTAAADPLQFPGQLKYVTVWKPHRLLWNTFRFGNTNTIYEGQFKIDVGGFNTLLGKSYGEISAESRSQHKSQGFGVPAGRGEAFEYFSITLGSEPKIELFDEINTGWSKIKGAEKITLLIDSLVKNFNLQNPALSVQGLTQLYDMMDKLPSHYWKEQKMKEVQDLIIACSGLWMDAYTNNPTVVQKDSLRVNVVLNDRSGAGITIQHVAMDDFDTLLNYKLQKNKNLALSKSVYVPADKEITQPFWLKEPKAEGYYNISEQGLIGKPDALPAYNVNVQLKVNDIVFSTRIPVRYRYTDPVKGEIYEPLVILPPVTVIPDERIKISKNTNRFEGTLKINAHAEKIKLSLSDIKTDHPDRMIPQINPDQVLFDENRRSHDVTYHIKGTRDNVYKFIADTESENSTIFLKEWNKIRYDHIPPIYYFSDASVTNHKVDLKISGKHVGYIPGAGDKVPDALIRMGYQVTILNESLLAQNDLQKFDAIITGIRAYNTNEWLNQHYTRLMKYIEEGGNLIVQYNTSNNIGSVKATIGPYPFDIIRTRITNEKSPVTFLKPAHAVLNFPNKITQQDFEGWIQERSIYHASGFNEKFETVLAMSDPGEKNEDGSLVIAKYGKGNFVYTGLVFFRQLPAGVPGAYRLLANIIALNQGK